jgi:signal transduction histidine kinase
MLPARADRLIYLRVLGPFVLATVTLAAVSIGGFNALSGARAYVGGESMWSKSVSRTLTQLRLRAGGARTPCQPLAQALAVPLGDRAARLALAKSPPDLATAREGLLRGGNPPADVEAMLRLYINFSDTPLLREPLDAWRVGDELVSQLMAVGERLCAGSGVRDDLALLELDRLDLALGAAELRYSSSLGQASRHSAQLLTGAILLLAALLAAGSAWYVMRSLRAQMTQRRALADANTRWDLAAQAAGIGLFVWNPQSDVVDLDLRARILYGLDPDTPVPRSVLQAKMHPEDRDDFSRLQKSAVNGGETLRARYRIVRADASIRYLDAVGMLRPGPQPTDPGQMFGVLRDVTDEVAASRLQLERDAAERSARARSEFLSRLSHELRTPLNAVLGLAQLLEIDKVEPLGAAQRERVLQILQSGWHLLHLVDDVLDITRIDSGVLAVRSVPTDLRAVLRASLSLVEPERARCNVRIDDRWPRAVPAALADPQRLQQVLVNLLSNACKYNRPQGVVRLSFAEAGNELLIGVADQGPGIEPTERAELFQPFKRLARTAGAPGTGLGLVVVKLLTEQMQGQVELASDPGTGSRFTLRLRKA